jgi:hypothetical protein
VNKRGLGAVALVLVAACGGAAQAPPAASSPVAAPTEDRAAPNSQSMPPPPPPADQPGAAAGARGAVAPELEAQRVHARADFDDAARQLDASMNECAAACRALASMERATAHLCDLARANDDDPSTCDDARKKLHAARDRVRRACTSCTGGPTLDPGAPP